MQDIQLTADQSELGKKSEYKPHYDPAKLFAIPRKLKRDEIGVPELLPFRGYDLWNHHEVSWLNQKGKPMVAMAEIIYPCESECIIESKSMKLYFNSLNNSRFHSMIELGQIIVKDISERVRAEVEVKLIELDKVKTSLSRFDGECIDGLDISCDDFIVNPELLSVGNEFVSESLFSNLLKSNCLVTNQPDWGSVQIQYKGKKINRESLLRYIVSFRNHNEFHEQCVERIFMDITRFCQPEGLTVYARYTRRGGLDINPFRTSANSAPDVRNIRLVRQ